MFASSATGTFRVDLTDRGGASIARFTLDPATPRLEGRRSEAELPPATPAKSPPAMSSPQLVYLPERRTTVLVGNGKDDAHVNAWEWDGVAWTELPGKPRPHGRFGHAMALDPVTQRALLHGGSYPPSLTFQWPDTWSLNGEAWQLLGEPPNVGGRVFPP